MEEYKLSHLKELEAESIHIIREVAAEFENPVMLYSIGKDSSVMVRLAEKAFYPGKVPFPLMHIDSKWKFKEMIQFRICQEIRMEPDCREQYGSLQGGGRPLYAWQQGAYRPDEDTGSAPRTRQV